MAVITFYTNCKEETGNTVSAISLATVIGITQNKRTLLLSTGLNDETINESLWPVQNKKKSGLFGPNTGGIFQNGIEELDRVIRSNRLTPEDITNYTKVALKGRLETLIGYRGSEEQYSEIQNNYAKIISVASRYYDNIIVDIDKRLSMKTKMEIINLSDVVVALTTQKAKNINDIMNIIQEGVLLNKKNTILALGKYDEKTKYNIKNVTRAMLKQKEPINVIPYNTVLFEASQEGKVIDVLWKFLNLKNKDENYFFIEEIKRLNENIQNKLKDLQLNR